MPLDVSSFSPEQLRQQAAQSLEFLLGKVKIENLIPWDEIQAKPLETITGPALAALPHDVRREVLDKLHDIALLPVFEKNTPEEREATHLGIDQGVRDAKWRHLLTVVNSAYDLGLDYGDLELLTPLYRQLATIERGSTSIHMPTTHKLRHNPAIHSLHVVGLISNIFDEIRAENNLDNDQLIELGGMKRQLMRAALVHDMGELQGELSVACDRKDFSAEQMEAFEQQRGERETKVFSDAIEKRAGQLIDKHWPDEKLLGKKDAFVEDYHLAENGDFLSRAHKIMERMQSQQDYLRFEGLSQTPPLRTVVPGYGDHKDFTLNYVREPLLGESGGEKNGPSLRELGQNFISPELAGLIVDKLHLVRGKLEAVQKERMQYKPKTFVERIMEDVPTRRTR